MEALLIIAGAIVLLAAIYAAWDAAKHRTDAQRFNQATTDRMGEIERALEKQHEQQQQILGKLSLAISSTRPGLGRIGGAR